MNKLYKKGCCLGRLHRKPVRLWEARFGAKSRELKAQNSVAISHMKSINADSVMVSTALQDSQSVLLRGIDQQFVLRKVHPIH